MSEMIFELANRYIDRLNAKILPRIDYIRLQESYETEEKAYAKGILHLLHDTAVKIYNREQFSEEDMESGPLVLPAVIDAGGRGTQCLGLVTIEKNCGRTSTDFFTKYGLLVCGRRLPAEIEAFMVEHYPATTYITTIKTPYSSQFELTAAAQDFADTFHNYKANLLPAGGLHLLEPEEELEEYR